MDLNSEDRSLIKMWLEALWSGMQAEIDGEIRCRILERCGRVCAQYQKCNAVVKEITEGSNDINDVISGLNQIEDLWCGTWHRDENIIYSYCSTCGCPLVRSGIVELTPVLCGCSLGWVREVFESILLDPIKVELVQAIGRGDPVCEFVVEADRKMTLRGRRSLQDGE